VPGISESTMLQIYDAHKIEEVERLFEVHFATDRLMDIFEIKL
jgi:hypothetical protein